MKHELYSLTFPNGKQYIGISKNATERFLAHGRIAKKGEGFAPVNKGVLATEEKKNKCRHCAMLDQAPAKELSKIYYSEYVKDNDVRKMKATGWSVKREVKNPEGSFEVTYVKENK
jgi:predicted GIY-YIG superfamily endonuclease